MLNALRKRIHAYIYTYIIRIDRYRHIYISILICMYTYVYIDIYILYVCVYQIELKIMIKRILYFMRPLDIRSTKSSLLRQVLHLMLSCFSISSVINKTVILRNHYHYTKPFTTVIHIHTCHKLHAAKPTKDYTPTVHQISTDCEISFLTIANSHILCRASMKL